MHFVVLRFRAPLNVRLTGIKLHVRFIRPIMAKVSYNKYVIFRTNFKLKLSRVQTDSFARK